MQYAPLVANVRSGDTAVADAPYEFLRPRRGALPPSVPSAAAKCGRDQRVAPGSSTSATTQLCSAPSNENVSTAVYPCATLEMLLLLLPTPSPLSQGHIKVAPDAPQDADARGQAPKLCVLPNPRGYRPSSCLLRSIFCTQAM
eukprot:COSAG01_NODE_6407_length_3683_cov_2.022321_2_plen_143_part_00